MRRYAAGAAVLAVAVTATAAAGAYASFPGANGRIAYSTLADDGKPRAIHTMSASGDHDRQLTRRGSAGNPSMVVRRAADRLRQWSRGR